MDTSKIDGFKSTNKLGVVETEKNEVEMKESVGNESLKPAEL